MSGKRSNEVVERRVWDDFGEKKRKSETWEWRRETWGWTEENKVTSRGKGDDIARDTKAGIEEEREDKRKDGTWWKEREKWKEKDRLYRLFLRFRTPPIIFLGAFIVTTSLLSSTSGKLRGMNAPLRSPGSVDLLLPWSFGIPYAETSWEDRRESTRHPTPPGIFLLVFASFAF